MNAKKKIQLLILEGLPGIGAFKANQLLNKFRTIKAIASATPQELNSTGDISQGLADRIWNLLN